ncbi:MAG: hypothetical protein ACXADY_07835 [Candidatus Hodarchaeales archaeon]
MATLFYFVAIILNGTIFFLSAKMKSREKRTAISVLAVTSVVCILVPVLILGTNSGGFMNGDFIAAYILDQEEGMLALLFCFVAVIINGTIFFLSVKMKSREKPF